LVSAVAKPEVSYLFVLPSLGAALACMLARADSGFSRPWQIRLATWMLCIGAVAFWFPVFSAMELGFDYELGYVLAAPLAVIALTLLPICARGSARALRGLSMAAGSVCAAAIATALAVPTSSPERPGWINLRYISGGPGREAHWEASTFGGELPRSLALAAPFERAHAPPFPWLTLDPSLFTAPAPGDRFDPPVWESIDHIDTDIGRVFRGRLRSARGASRLHLHLPPEIRLQSVDWNGHVVRGGFENTSTQLLFGLSDQGVEVEFVVRDRRAASFWILDQDWKLPPEAAALLAARPSGFIPRSDGDVSIVGREVTLE
jgi:hypothetical protein